MRNTTFRICIALTGVGVIRAAPSTAATRDPPSAEAAVTRHSTNEKTPGAIREREIRMSPLVPIRPDAKVVRVVVTVGADGSSEIAYGEVSGPQVSCDESDDAVYCNTLGRFVFGPAGSLFDVRIADDISMTATQDTRCELDRFVLNVTGDRDQDGSGTPLGDYTVHYALYRYCPGAHVFPRPIPGTENDVVVPAENAGDIIEIVHEASGGIEAVNLPSNVYLGVSFSREGCGVVVGAPATHGFSADRFDYPGFPCRASLGGFPEFQHASFYAEIYVRGECSDSYVGYKNSNHGATSFSAGRNRLFADNIRLAADECNLIGYQLAHRGNGIIQVDLKTALSPGERLQAENGNLIPGTRAFIWSFGDDIQVHNQSFAPVDLSVYDQVWVAFKTTTAVAGPVLTCKFPALGETANLYMVYDETLQGWTTVDGDESCWLGFDLTLFCEGLPPIGACCDMILTEDSACVGGPDDGLPCIRIDRDDCPEGACVGDAVCREVPEMNCPFNRWAEGEVCAPDPFDPPCGTSACCRPDDTCENLTIGECLGLVPPHKPILWQEGEFCELGTQKCPFYACLLKKGDCFRPHANTGCEAFACCQAVCEIDRWCCSVGWDEICVREVYEICYLRPPNDSCFDPYPDLGALLVDANSSTVVGNISATQGADDPGFSCHSTSPGSRGVGTVWFRFVATHTSAILHTCNSAPPADDSLLAIYVPVDPSTPETACNTLFSIGCSDDEPGCGTGSNSSICVNNLIPGQIYYVQLAARTYDALGVYRLDIESPCPRMPLLCSVWDITWVDPPEGVVDARQPFALDDPSDLRGIDVIRVGAPWATDPRCFMLSETSENVPLHPPYPPELETNEIRNIVSNGDGTYMLMLARPITPGEITSITYTDGLGTASTGCFAAHPGNVNGDGAADPDDISALIDVLNGDALSPWGIYSEDIDHSGRLTPADLLRGIDLLNGAGPFAPGWNGTSVLTTKKICP